MVVVKQVLLETVFNPNPKCPYLLATQQRPSVDWVGNAMGRNRLDSRREVHFGSRQKVVCAVAEHLAGKVFDNRLGILVEVAEDSIRLPSADKFDDIVRLISAHEGHGSASLERPSADVRQGNASGMLTGCDGSAKIFGDLGSTDS